MIVVRAMVEEVSVLRLAQRLTVATNHACGANTISCALVPMLDCAGDVGMVVKDIASLVPVSKVWAYARLVANLHLPPYEMRFDSSGW